MLADWLSQTSLIAMLLIFVGAYVQTAIGFGLAIVAAPLLFQVSPDYVPAPICLVALFISLLNAMKHRSNIAIGGLKMAMIGRVPGSIAGAALLLYVSTQVLSLWLGLLVVFAVVVSLLPMRIEPTRQEWVLQASFPASLALAVVLVVRQWHFYFSIKKRISYAATYQRSLCSAQSCRLLCKPRLAFLLSITSISLCHSFPRRGWAIT